jgi:hypothetical protein
VEEVCCAVDGVDDEGWCGGEGLAGPVGFFADEAVRVRFSWTGEDFGWKGEMYSNEGYFAWMLSKTAFSTALSVSVTMSVATISRRR